MKSATVKKVTPLLFAKDIELCVRFWTEAMGLNKTIEVPDGDKLAFVQLEKDGMELMYQSFASVEKDNPRTAEAVKRGPSFLYVEVEDLNDALNATSGAESFMDVRSTFYGSKEFGVKDPAGHYITFAQQGAAESAS